MNQLITEVEVLAGNAWSQAMQCITLVENSETNTWQSVEETVGDCAYGEGRIRQAFTDAQHKLVAKVPDVGRNDQIHMIDGRPLSENAGFRLSF